MYNQGNRRPPSFKANSSTLPLLRKNAKHWGSKQFSHLDSIRNRTIDEEREDREGGHDNKLQTTGYPIVRTKVTVPLETFKNLVEQTGYQVPKEHIPRLFQQYNSLTHSLHVKNQPVDPFKVVRGMLAASPLPNTANPRNAMRQEEQGHTASREAPQLVAGNQNQPIVINTLAPGASQPHQIMNRAQRRRSVPPPPSYDLLPPDQRRALIHRRSSLPGAPVLQTKTVPMGVDAPSNGQQLPLRQISSAIAPGHIPRPNQPPPPAGASDEHNTNAIARRFKDKIHAAMIKRSRDTQQRHIARIRALEEELRIARQAEEEKQKIIDEKVKKIQNLEAMVRETEDRMEQQLQDAISTNEELQAVHHNLLKRNMDYKLSSRRNRQKLDTIFDITKQVFITSKPFSLPSIIRDLKERASQILDAEKVDIYLVDWQRNELVSFREKVKSNRPPPHGANVWRGRYPMDCGLVGETITNATVQLVEDVAHDERFDGFVDGIGVNGVRSFASSPVALRNKVAAVIVAVNKNTTNAATDSESQLSTISTGSTFTSADMSSLHDLSLFVSLILQKQMVLHEEGEDTRVDDVWS